MSPCTPGLLLALLCGMAVAVVTAQQQCYDLQTAILARSGDKFGRGTFGVQTDVKAQPVVQILSDTDYRKPLSSDKVSTRARGRFSRNAELVDAYSNGPDMPTFQEVGGKTFMINHFEYPQPSTAYVSVLTTDSSGKLTVVNTAPVDDTSPKVQGLWFMCRGEKTPWGTHLAGEEYPPDCAEYEEVFLPCTNTTDYCGYDKSFIGKSVLQFARFYGFYQGAEAKGHRGASLTGNNLQEFKQKFSCYNYGASPEISVANASGTTNVIKWRTLGRISHETAVVMPDQRTVYTTDDGSANVLLMFKADRPGDLSAGTLYAARFQSKGKKDGKDIFDVYWIRLGYGKQSELEALALNPNTTFSDMFEIAEVGPNGTCPGNFSQTNPPSAAYLTKVNGKQVYVQCLKIKEGKENIAAFLESQRVAAIMGATTEFEKLEGFTFNPESNTTYMAASRVDKAMLKRDAMDGLGPDHLQMDQNLCGAIFAMKLDGNYEITSAEVLLAGNNKTNTDALNRCDINAIAGPDNVYYTNGNLLIAEDTSAHFNNYLWAYNLKTGNLSRILSAPTGAEITGPSMQWSGGRAYLTWAMQHPLDWEGTKVSRDAQEEEAMRAYIGYLGPLPASALNQSLDFSAGEFGAPYSGNEKLQIRGAQKGGDHELHDASSHWASQVQLSGGIVYGCKVQQ